MFSLYFASIVGMRRNSIIWVILIDAVIIIFKIAAEYASLRCILGLFFGGSLLSQFYHFLRAFLFLFLFELDL